MAEPAFPLKRSYPKQRAANGEYIPVYPATVVELRHWVAEEWRRAGLEGQISDKAAAERIAIQAAAEIVADAVQWLDLLAARPWVAGPEPKTPADASREISRLLRDIDALIAGLPYDRAAAENETRCRIDALFFAVDDIRQWSIRTFRGWEPGSKRQPEEYREQSVLQNRFDAVSGSVAHIPLLLRKSAEKWQPLLRELKDIGWRLLNANALWAKDTSCTGPAETMRDKADAAEAAARWFEKEQHKLDQVMRDLRRQASLLEYSSVGSGTLEPEHQSDSTSPRHSPDFRSVSWYGTSLSFTAIQAASVKVLWKAWEQNTPEVGGDTILEAVGSTADRLEHIFRTRDGKKTVRHKAWGTMIVPGSTRGSFQLAPPT